MNPVTSRAALTDRERETLDALRQFIADAKFPPTVRELGDLIGCSSSSTVAYLLSRLVGKGYIVRVHGRSRALAIID